MTVASLDDLRARRASAPRDARSIIDAIADGAESLHASVSAWPLSVVRESTIVGAERHMVALAVLLNELRQYTPTSSEGGGDAA